MQAIGGEPAIHEFEMNITRAEFERLLGPVVGHFVHLGDGRYASSADAPAWTITLAALPERCLGLLRIAPMHVRIDLVRVDGSQRAAWLERFWRYYQRGGG